MHKRCEPMSHVTITAWQVEAGEEMSLGLLMRIVPAACGLALLTFGFLVLAFSV